MDLQELSYFTHVKYCLDKKNKAQIKIRKWYQFLKMKQMIRMYVYNGAYFLTLMHRYTINESCVFFKMDDESTECVFNNKREMREYLLRIILKSTMCYFIKNDRYDNIFVIS